MSLFLRCTAVLLRQFKTSTILRKKIEYFTWKTSYLQSKCMRAGQCVYTWGWNNDLVAYKNRVLMNTWLVLVWMVYLLPLNPMYNCWICTQIHRSWLLMSCPLSRCPIMFSDGNGRAPSSDVRQSKEVLLYLNLNVFIVINLMTWKCCAEGDSMLWLMKSGI